MSKVKQTVSTTHTSVHKRTSIGHGRLKTSTMNKTKRKAYKKYRGQGR